jgi:hypothetical protein
MRLALQREEGILHRLVGHAAYVPPLPLSSTVSVSVPTQPRDGHAQDLSSTPAAPVMTRSGKIALWWTWLLRGVQLADARAMPTALSPSATLAIHGSSDRCVCVYWDGGRCWSSIVVSSTCCLHRIERVILWGVFSFFFSFFFFSFFSFLDEMVMFFSRVVEFTLLIVNTWNILRPPCGAPALKLLLAGMLYAEVLKLKINQKNHGALYFAVIFYLLF